MQFFSKITKGLSLSLLSLLVFQNAIAAPLEQTDTLSKRDTRYISLQEAQDYLKDRYPETDQYLLYSGGSRDQLQNFQGLNAGYYAYNDFFDSTVSQNFDDYFGLPEQDVDVDADTGSQAIATVATDIHVFGAIKYQDWPNSFYSSKEAPYLLEGVNDGRLKTINHMQKGATTTDQVLATEDGEGTITYVDGQSGDNASGAFGDCSQTDQPPECDTPDQ